MKLKATIKAAKQKPGDKAPRFHLDTVDLYSNRSRLFFAKACAVLFSEKEEIITEDASKLIDLAESWTPPNKEQSPAAKMTKRRRRRGPELPERPRTLLPNPC